MKKLLGISAALVGLIALTTSASAQIIDWGTAQDMSTDTDVSTAGTYVDAASFYGNDTVNTVAFNALTGSQPNYSDASGDIAVFANNGTYGGSSFTGGSANYQKLVNQFGFGFFSNGSVTLSGLTAGQQYQVQVWSSYQYAPGGDSTTLTGSTPVTLVPEDNQFTIGTFTATGATESFSYDFNAGGYDLINAISVRDVTAAVPEPSTAWLLGLGVFGLVFYLRRQRSV